MNGSTPTARSSSCSVNRSRQLVTAPLHRSCDLLLKATRGVTIAVVSALERKRRQPGLATDDPAFVGWHQLVRSVQGSEVHFDFVCAACENGGAAAGTERPPEVVACFAVDRHRILREYRGSVKEGPMMLAAVETVTNADPVWESRRHNSDVAAQATAGESVHAFSFLRLGPGGVATTLLRSAPVFDGAGRQRRLDGRGPSGRLLRRHDE